MGVGFDIIYHKLVVKEDISKLSAKDKKRIQSATKEKLSLHPETFGRPLRQQLKGYRKLRVGDYRIIFRIENKTVKVFYIGHRSVVYRQVRNRILQ